MRYLFYAMFIALTLASCNKQGFLDQTQSTDLNEQVVFSDSAYTINFLSSMYADIGFATWPKRFGGGGLDACTDEAEGTGLGSINTFIQFATGTVNSNMITKDAWTTAYTNIRRANIMLKNLPAVKFGDDIKVRVKAETRFLRAYYCFILLEHYGGIPLMGDSVYRKEDHIPAVRNTFEECVEYIVTECDAAAEDLPWMHIGENYGRVSKAACYGLKSRLLLYAASPLFNGDAEVTDERLRAVAGYPDIDPSRWERAEQAAAQVMEGSGGQYHLHVNNDPEPGYGFYEVFQLRKNSEYLLARMQASNSDLEGIWNPPTFGVSSPGARPYLEMVNAFGMKNGLPIDDPASGYDPEQPYKDRDPRFANTITRDQSLVFHRDGLARRPVNIYIDKTDPNTIKSGQDAVYKGTPTGYYTYKMLNRDVAADWFNTYTPRCFPIIRYAEILLNFAEARNERLASPDPEVYQAVEAIRERAGLSPYQLQAGLTQAEMREIIRNERRKELAFEGHRFFDVRRWKIAEEVENSQLHGTEPARTSSGTLYSTINVRKRVFNPRMYLWPIPQSEVAKSADLIQNQGY
ncbi:RagB/SusD family nutrient uptake outer membrane protein [Parapedobacter indicus]|uniref:Starch-binding associating with outer membrane n=1 Tax=Parapedobacter indicus TaxID=1477437 RepID=A0A1I3D3S0_9SPHI|nr:RagB/SusD family nutrient uptake outer membrane protein [Parapedobacter indicus]PPL04517.1 putative outer membrane starch-binding protein [Parapedobacter indicus]SFH81424.1 Starch-binding associating with outer membrane [Parapedobacter indicus]